ncbi:HTH-type transcriptional activator Btr [compost metagenome]
MSHSNFYKKIKAISGQTINEFIRSVRLKKAAEILINTDAKINEAADMTGFYDIKYFREQFKKLFGSNPSDYVKKYRKAFQNRNRLPD